MRHRIVERGLIADYPIAYSIGFGKVGHSYLIDLGGRLFQSPASYFTAGSQWGPSPGYESEPILDFNRSITSDCLFCHAGDVKREQNTVSLTAITCERCHGPSAAHLHTPVPGSIVNPAKLTGRARDSVCEQCHLEGATVVLNPGKYWYDFRPGEPLEKVETHYVYRIENDGAPSLLAVSQAEQLVLSACLKNSNGKLWCGSCHDPHGAQADRRTQIAKVCSSCHPSSQLAAAHSPSQTDCAACHMPRRPAGDTSHAAVTDHRITRNPSLTPIASAPASLVVWQAPAADLATRNRGLALFETARRTRSATNYQEAFRLLSTLPEDKKDAEVQAALGYLQLGIGRLQAALVAFQKAVQQRPTAEFFLDLGVAQSAANDNTSAINSFRRSIELDPYDYRSYRALSRLYSRLGQNTQSQSVEQQFLQLVPQSLIFRLAPN